MALNKPKSEISDTLTTANREKTITDVSERLSSVLSLVDQLQELTRPL